ncbi:MAG: hypothetical protein GXO19_04090, partial [Epsilonproteobacteria bacterium]|nr:hypothetical protein [Campylobacterota bacterium]NPA56902.1 hypothetical protein [Campylobacterota bacterium]
QRRVLRGSPSPHQQERRREPQHLDGRVRISPLSHLSALQQMEIEGVERPSSSPLPRVAEASPLSPRQPSPQSGSESFGNPEFEGEGEAAVEEGGEPLFTPTHLEEFQELLENQPKRFLRFHLPDTRVEVQLLQNRVAMEFISDQIFQSEGVEGYIDEVMQEHGFERYQVALKDRRKSLTVRSREEGRGGATPRGAVDVKV